MFENSDAETKTTTEKGFVEGFANQMGNIGAIMIYISVAVLVNILLIAASTMVQATRERTSEIAVLKTLGFSNTRILSLVLGESVFICLLGGGLGLFAGWLFVQGGDPTNGMLPIFVLQPQAIAAGVILILSMGILAGLLPALSAMQLKITDGLRRN
jgi:putative ABC transport system permease protein